MCCATQSNVGMGVCMCVSSSNKSPVHSYLCVCHEALLGVLWKKRPEMCKRVCAHVRSRVGMGVCMRVCVCHHHSPVDSFLCVYVSICMLTPLNDCDYIRQYFTVLCNTKFFVLKMVFYSYISTSCNLLSSQRKKKVKRFHLICQCFHFFLLNNLDQHTKTTFLLTPSLLLTVGW